MAAFGAATFLTTFLAKRLVPHVQHTSTGGLTTTISDSNGAAVLGCSDQRTLVRAPEGAAVYQRVRLLPRPFRAAQMQKWRRVGGAGGGLPPVVTVIDWGGGGLVDPPDFREIHVIRGDLKTPAEVHGRPQRKRSTASQCQLAPLPASQSTDAKTVNCPNPQAGGRTRERCDCAADFPLLAEDLQGTAGLQPFLTQTQTLPDPNPDPIPSGTCDLAHTSRCSYARCNRHASSMRHTVRHTMRKYMQCTM